MIITSDLVKLL